MGVLLILIAIVIIASIIYFSSKGKSSSIPEITNVSSIRDVVMAVNYGRIYPFFTRMNLERVKGVVGKSGVDTVAFENSLHLQELIGNVRGVQIPLLNDAFVSDIYVSFNKNQVVSSITINISKIEFSTLVEQMLLKFGKPISINKQLMVWRDGYMTISLDSTNKYINVMDETLCLIK